MDKAVDNRGKTPPTETEGEYPLLEVAALGKGSPDYSKVAKYVNEETYNNWFRAHIEEDDILFSTVGNTGLVSLMDDYKGATIAQNLVAFRAKAGNNPGFLATMLQLPENSKKAKQIEMGAVQPSIKVSQLIHVKYAITPNLEEQQKIGSFFNELDQAITLHHRKCFILKYLFSSKLHNINAVITHVAINFRDFTNPWEQRKLKYFISGEIKGKARADLPLGTATYLDTEYLNGGNIKFVNSAEDTLEDDLIILWDGSKAGSVYYGFSGALGSTLKRYKVINSGSYLYQFLKFKQEVIFKNFRTPNIPHVVKTFTEEFSVPYTKKEEQITISILLETLDKSITLHQCE